MALVRKKAATSVTWWVGIALAIVAGGAYVASRDYGRAGVMPGLASLAIGGLAILHTVYGLVFGVVADDEEWHDEQERKAFTHRRWGYVLVALAVVVGIWLVGFHITLPLFLLLFIGLTLRKWVVAAMLAALVWAFTYLVLGQVLHVVFPASVLQKLMIAQGWF